MRIAINRLAAIVLAVTMLAPSAMARQILVSAEDGKPVRPGDTVAVAPDLLRVLSLQAGDLRTLATVAAPASMVGPPESVKMTRDGRYAIVSAAQRAGRAGEPPLVPADTVSLIDLKMPQRPRLIETVHAGAGASGVAIAPRGDLVLVANARADSLSLFTLVGGHLSLRNGIALPPGTHPVSARFLDDGRSALVVSGAGRVLRLDIDGSEAVIAPHAAEVGSSASGIALSPDGRTAYVAASRIAGDRHETFVAAIDTATLRVTPGPVLPPAAEGLALSPSGRFLEVTLLDGSNLPSADPAHRDTGVMAILSVRADTLRPLAHVETGRVCQGAAWSADERAIFLQCADDRRIESYSFDGHASLRRTGLLATPGRPGAMAGADYR